MNNEPLFSYKPRSTSRISLWFWLIGPLFLSIASVQETTEETAATLVLINIAVWLFCILMILFLRGVSRRMTRNNAMTIDANGMLSGSFGGIKIQKDIKAFKRIEVRHVRNATKIWGEPKDGSGQKLLMAFLGDMGEELKTTFRTAVESFGVECVT